MGFETTILPLTTAQVALYATPAASFSTETLDNPSFGEKPRLLPIDYLLSESQFHSQPPTGSWLAYDEDHFFHPHWGLSLYVGDQKPDVQALLAGRRYGESIDSQRLPPYLTLRKMPQFEEIKSYVLEYGGFHYILEAVSPRQELLFRRVGRPKWSGLGEDHLIVFKKDGEWFAERQSQETKEAPVKIVGEGLEAAHFEHQVFPSVSKFWVPNKKEILIHTTNPASDELPSVSEVQEALRVIPSFLVGGINAVQLVDEEHVDAEKQYFAVMDPKGIIYFYRGSRNAHLHATLFHELAHWFAMQKFGNFLLPGQAHWIRAMMQDAASPSQYATTTIGEGLAESTALYFLTGGGRFGKAPVYFRNYFALLDQLFYDCFTAEYHNKHSIHQPPKSPYATFLTSER